VPLAVAAQLSRASGMRSMSTSIWWQMSPSTLSVGSRPREAAVRITVGANTSPLVPRMSAGLNMGPPTTDADRETRSDAIV